MKLGSCVFCAKIRAGDYEEGYPAINRPKVVAFTPLKPVTPGHRLIVPVEHLGRFIDHDGYTAGLMQRMVARICAREGIAEHNIITSAGPAATQTVFHTHLHLLPRYPGDGLVLPWTNQIKEC